MPILLHTVFPVLCVCVYCHTGTLGRSNWPGSHHRLTNMVLPVDGGESLFFWSCCRTAALLLSPTHTSSPLTTSPSSAGDPYAPSLSFIAAASSSVVSEQNFHIFFFRGVIFSAVCCYTCHTLFKFSVLLCFFSIDFSCNGVVCTFV